MIWHEIPESKYIAALEFMPPATQTAHGFQFDQAFPNIRLFSFFGEVETLTRICVVLLRRIHHGHTQP